jgi:hypothetical protein
MRDNALGKGEPLPSVAMARWMAQVTDAANTQGSARLSVKDFGALGDGSTNDAAAIQAGTDAVNSLGGGTLFFPFGVYVVDVSQIDFKGGVTWELEAGTTLDLRATVASDRRIKFSGDNVAVVCNGGVAYIEGNRTVPVRLLYGAGVSTELFDNSPEDSKLTSDSSIGGEGITGITFRNIVFRHTAGYSIWHKDCNDITYERVRCENCRPNYVGTSSLDMNYGFWTGCIFHNGNIGCKKIRANGCSFYRVSGNGFWFHSTSLTNHHEDVQAVDFQAQYFALDVFMIGNVLGGEFSGVMRDGGMTTQTDIDAPVEAILIAAYSVAFDTAGYAEKVRYKPTTIDCVAAVDLDGARNCTVLGPQISGPNRTISKGIQPGDTNANGGGYGIDILGGSIADQTTSAVVLNQSENCSMLGVLITHPATASGVPVALYSLDMRTKGTIVRGNIIFYEGANYCIAEIGGGFDATTDNRVYDNHIRGVGNLGEFAKDASSASVVYNEQDTVWQTGGTGTPGGVNHSVQYKNGAVFAGFGLWDAPTKQLTLTGDTGTAGLVVATSYIQSEEGFYSPNTATSAVNVPLGGVTGKYLIATESINLVEDVLPGISGAGQARLAMDSTGHVVKMSVNGGAYFNLVGGGGSILPITADNVNFRVGINNATPQATLDILSLEPAGNIDSYRSKQSSWFLDSYNVASSASSAHSGFVIFQVSNGTLAAPSAVSTGRQGGGFSFRYHNGSSFDQLAIISSFKTSAGAKLSFQTGVSSAGVAERTNIDETGTWHIGATAPADNGSGAIVQVDGFMSATLGYYTTSAAANAVNIPNGGGTAVSWSSVRNDGGQSFALKRTAATARDWSLKIAASGALQIIDETSGNAKLGFFVSGEVRVQTGDLNVHLGGYQVAAVTIVDGSRNATFTSVTTNAGGVIQSGASGASIAFQTTNSNFQADGNGNVSGAGSANFTQGFKVAGNVMINNLGQFVGFGISMPNAAYACGAGIFATWNTGLGAYSFGVTGTQPVGQRCVVAGGIVINFVV